MQETAPVAAKWVVTSGVREAVRRTTKSVVAGCRENVYGSSRESGSHAQGSCQMTAKQVVTPGSKEGGIKVKPGVDER